jgi:hypothetical protein
LSLANPHGNFTLEWWAPFLKGLNDWIATRPIAHSVLTSGFKDSVPALSEASAGACEPFLDDDISTVTWDQVQAFPSVLAGIKPTMAPPVVFTSKFCHFLLLRICPVLDNEDLRTLDKTKPMSNKGERPSGSAFGSLPPDQGPSM